MVPAGMYNKRVAEIQATGGTVGGPAPGDVTESERLVFQAMQKALAAGHKSGEAKAYMPAMNAGLKGTSTRYYKWVEPSIWTKGKNEGIQDATLPRIKGKQVTMDDVRAVQKAYDLATIDEAVTMIKRLEK